MAEDINTTYRLVDLIERGYGQTAVSKRLAMASLGQMDRSNRLGVERTDWDNSSSRPKPFRTILIEMEDHAGEWDDDIQ